MCVRLSSKEMFSASMALRSPTPVLITPFRMTLRSDELPMTVATWFSAVCSLLDRSGLNSGSAVLPAGWPWAGDLTSLCGGCDKSLVLSQRAAVRRGSSVFMCKVRGPESTTTACAL